ncbi:MAG: SDR family oxidoreductase [Bacteroidia bacterium]|nr:SDR family oxidoreductase [Bacteroidia bacterium]
MDLTGKTIIITGASSGIGEACAYAFAKHKVNLVLAARNIHKLEEVKIACERSGSKTICIKCDVSKEEDCKNLIDETIKNFEHIHVLINNAGISMRALFIDTGFDVLKRIMDVNFWGAVYCSKFALSHLLKDNGSLISISSFAGYKGLPGRTGYCASKYALNGFMESLRTENIKTNLHVGVLSPGYTASNIRNTALNAKGQPQSESPLDESKLMQPDKVAESVLKMVQKRTETEILTKLSKTSLWVNKFFPKFVDRIIYKTIAKEKDSPFK